MGVGRPMAAEADPGSPPDMCGITGFWNFRTGRPADPRRLRAMTATLTHRGPDEEGYWVEGAVGLGMRRLRVIDPAGGRQPMANEDGSIQVVFNGEIYNHADLRGELEASGHHFRTRSDTEVLAHGYEAWGPEMLDRLNGMFALALWDRPRARLLLARDRLGIKPLYLAESAEGVVFGSELKAVMASPDVALEWDLEALDDFLTYEYIPAPRTLVRGVEKLLPGHRVLFQAGRSGAREEVRYWGLEAKSDPGGGAGRASHAGQRDRDVATMVEELHDRLGLAVRRRMVADVPVGAFLSGGVDSSTVVRLMCEARDGTSQSPSRGSGVHTYALGFADPSYDERAHARTVAQYLGTAHVEREVTPAVVELAPRIMDHFDEPFADVSAFPTFLLSSLAREEVTVALSGDGGDELLAGYDHYRAHQWAGRLRWLGGRVGWRTAHALLDLGRPTASKKGATNMAQRFAEGMLRPADLQHARWWVFQDLADRQSLYSPELSGALQGRDPFAHYRARLAEGRDRGFHGLQQQLYSDVTGYLPDDILTKVDRMSMAVSLEARVPFLDHEFVEFAMSIPANLKLRGGRSKWILKEAMRGRLPGPVLDRGKQGFSMPMKTWLRGVLRPLMHELLDDVGERGWFDRQEIRRLAEEHVAGRRNHAHRLWCLMSLELSVRGLEARVSAREAAS